MLARGPRSVWRRWTCPRALAAACLGLSSTLAGAVDDTREQCTDATELGLRVCGTGEALLVVPTAAGKPEWTLSLAATGFGRPGRDALRDGLVASVAAGPTGVSQRLTLREPGGAPGRAWLEIAVTGLLPKVEPGGRVVTLYRADGEAVLAYSPSVSDAAGRRVGAEVEALPAAAGFRVVLDDGGARYPLDYVAALAAPGAPASRTDQPPAPLAAPDNDLCGGAESIPADGPFPYLTGVTSDITEAGTTGDPPTPNCQANVQRSIWYRFTPAVSGNYSITDCADEPTATTVDDTVLAVYTSSTGDCAGLFTQVSGGCDDDSCTSENFQSAAYGVPLVAGTPYFIVVWQWGTTAPTPGHTAIQLRVTQTPDPPVNDVCAGSEVIPGAGPFPYLTAVTADITGATSAGDPPAPSCASIRSRSVWYAFTPAQSGAYSISTCADAPTASTVDDTEMALYTSSDGQCGGAWTQVAAACDGDSCVVEDAQAVISPVVLTAGQPYFIVVWKYGTRAPATGQTAVQLRVDQVEQPANDHCAAPVALTLGVPRTGTNQFSANDFQLSGAACFSGLGQAPVNAAGRDVVYSFTAPVAGEYSFRAGVKDTSNPVLFVAGTCPPGGPPVVVGSCLAAANRNLLTSPGAEEVSCLGLAAGQQVFAFVDESALTGGTTHTIEVQPCIGEVEPNDAPPVAGPLACPVHGVASPAGDVDFYDLGAPVGGARIYAMADGLAAGENDFDMRITTATDTLEYDDSNLFQPFATYSPTIGGVKATGAQVFVRLNHFSPAIASEPYRLYTTIQPPSASATSESENNDTISTADAAVNNYFAGALDPVATDVDVFKIVAHPDPDAPLQPGTLIFASSDGDPAFEGVCTDLKLELLDAAGAVLLLVDDDNYYPTFRTPVPGTLTGTPTSCAESLVYRVQTAGDYYLRARISTAQKGNYLLSISLGCVATCDDGNACTVGDTVVDGVCAGGPPRDCDDGDPCTADSCLDATGACHHMDICCNDLRPRAAGHYGRLCDGTLPPPSDPLTAADVACVAGTCTFAAVDSVAELCAVLAGSKTSDACQRADAELMALRLNVCRGEICAADPVSAVCAIHATAGDAFGHADALLCNPRPTVAECLLATCAPREVNTGVAVQADTLVVDRLGAGEIRLTWHPPLHDASRTILGYRVWRAAADGAWELAAEVAADALTWIDVEAGAAEFLRYEVSTVLD